jgi:iron complex transport system permease protein
MDATLLAVPPRSRLRPGGMLVVFGALLALAVVASLSIGAVRIPVPVLIDLLASLFDPARGAEIDAGQRAILLQVRLPRLCLGIAVGVGLAMGGVLMQALFRNPLADPTLIGVSSGAALAAVGTIVFGGVLLGGRLPLWLSPYLLPAMAFFGGLVATVIVFRAARRDGGIEVATLLLIGIAVNALCATGIGLLVFVSDDQQLRMLTFWNLGSLGAATWPLVAVVTPVVLAIGWLALRLATALDLIQLGEIEAAHLGIRVGRLKRIAVLATALLVGLATGAAGIIGFVGLVVPHLVRLLVGPSHRWVAPGALLLGAALVLGADVLARVVVAPAELPLGLVTSAIGAPFFLGLLLLRERRGLLA